MKILVTGTAGFIGYYVVKALLLRGDKVVGIDNINDYYDITLKQDRLLDTGIRKGEYGQEITSTLNPGYRFIQMDLTDRQAIDALFEREQFDAVCHLAAQAGVRYSVENPYAYIQSNVVGFLNIMENCRNHLVKHFVYASSSSIYGLNEDIPYKETDKTDRPASLYAATKKADELMAHAYSKLYNLPATGLRFFTVYGPWGRPDMAPFLFMKAITGGNPIQVFNHGDMLRDFTYIDDIVEGVVRVIDAPPTGGIPYRIYNIGNSAPVQLEAFIKVIEEVTGKKAVKQYMEMQPGDVPCTYADTSRLEADLNYKPSTTIEEGITAFYKWYKERYLNK